MASAVETNDNVKILSHAGLKLLQNYRTKIE